MAHTFVNPLTHLIFSTKNREPLIVLDLKFDPLACMGGIVRELKGKTVAYRFRGNSSASSIRTVFDTASGTFRNDVLRPSGAIRRHGGTFSHGLRHGLNSSAPSRGFMCRRNIDEVGDGDNHGGLFCVAGRRHG